MSKFYKYHLFFCTNQRNDGRESCQQHDAISLRNYAKQKVKELGLERVRVNSAGCLNRCALGPMLVIYPEGIWYQYQTEEDIDEIITRHLIQGKIVKRLQR